MSMFEQAKQLMDMRSQMKKMQKDVEDITEKYENGGVKVTVRGDVTVLSVEIDPSAADPAKLAKLERTITENTNKALNLVKKRAAEMTRQLLKNNGSLGALGSMFGR